jgi:GAF domain-containing protein
MNKKQSYESLLLALTGVLEGQQNPLSIYANVSALIKQHFPHFSWVGFYLFDGSELYLGPFQGKVACVSISLNRGVCGAAAKTRKTQVVKNVHDFPGHIACDEGSNSEIVVPLLKGQKLLGVLDVDSYQLAQFDEIDQLYLERLVSQLVQFVA